MPASLQLLGDRQHFFKKKHAATFRNVYAFYSFACLFLLIAVRSRHVNLGGGISLHFLPYLDTSALTAVCFPEEETFVSPPKIRALMLKLGEEEMKKIAARH